MHYLSIFVKEIQICGFLNSSQLNLDHVGFHKINFHIHKFKLMPRDSDTPTLSSYKLLKEPIYRHRSMGLFNLLEIKILCSFSIKYDFSY